MNKHQFSIIWWFQEKQYSTVFYKVCLSVWALWYRSNPLPLSTLHQSAVLVQHPTKTYQVLERCLTRNWVQIVIPRSFWCIDSLSISRFQRALACFLRMFWEFPQAIFKTSALCFCKTQGQEEWNTWPNGRHPRIDPYLSWWVLRTFSCKNGRCSLNLREHLGSAST